MAKNLTAALALMGASAAAGAAPVSITETITLSQLLSGGSANINFNITSQLAAAGQSSANITAGDLVVFGYSDAQYAAPAADPYSAYMVTGSSSRTVPIQYTYMYYSPGHCYYSFWGGSYCYSGYYGYATAYYNSTATDVTTVRSRDVEHIDAVADTMTVTAGDTTASDSASTHTQSVGAYGNPVYERTDGDYYNGYLYRYNRERDIYDAIAGELQASLQLDSAALADLGADGILSALVAATEGSFHLTSATLTVLAEAPDPSKVPEPGTLGLLAAAAAGGALARRRKKQ